MDAALIIQLDGASRELQKTLVRKLASFSLSARAHNVCTNANLQRIGDLVQLRQSDLFRLRNVGRLTAHELANLVRKLDLEFGISIPDWSPDEALRLEREFSAEISNDVKIHSKEVLALVGSKPTSLEEELIRIVRALDNERNAEILIKLWGCSGYHPRTLESVGTEMSLTRERVRQIEARSLRKLNKYKFETPYLRSTLAQLRKITPASMQEISTYLKSEGLTHSEFSAAGVKKAAQIFGLSWPLADVQLAGVRFFVTEEDEEKIARILLVVRRRTSKFGCLNIFSLALEVGFDESFLTKIRKCLEQIPGIEWLDDDKDWLYLRGSPRNRLFNLCSKVLGVCNRIRVAELRRAISKSRRLQMAPPKHILSAFIERSGLGEVHQDIVIADSSKTTRLSPDSAEGIMLAVLEKNGPIMDGELLAEKCVEAGMNTTTFYIYRAISPVISVLGKGVFAKVGSEVPPGLIEEISSRRIATRASDHAWMSNGHLLFGVELSRIVINAGSIILVPFVANLVQGDWAVNLPDGARPGIVTCKDSFIRSFRKAFSILGAEPDDFAAFEFDMKSRKVIVRVGGPGLFESIQEFKDYESDEDDPEDEDEENLVLEHKVI